MQRHVLPFLLILTLANGQKFVRSSFMGLKVYTRVSISSVRGVSAVTSSFVIEGTFEFTWKDNSMYAVAYDGDPYTSGTDANSMASQSQFAYGRGNVMYGPKLTLDIQKRLSTSYEITTWNIEYGTPDWTGLPFEDEDTYVSGYTRFSYTISQNQDLRDFPLDSQSLIFSFTGGPYNASDMEFILVPSSISSTIIPSWSPDGFTVLPDSRAIVKEDAYGRTQVVTTLKIERIPEFFINRFVVPLSLIFTMATLFTLVAPSARLMTPMTVFASTISFLFVSGQSVPQLPYFTRLDRFFLQCFAYAAALFFYHIIIYVRFERLKAVITSSEERNSKKVVWCPCGRPQKSPVTNTEATPQKGKKGKSKSPSAKSNPLLNVENAEKGRGEDSEFEVLKSMLAIWRAKEDKEKEDKAKKENKEPKDVLSIAYETLDMRYDCIMTLAFIGAFFGSTYSIFRK